MLALVIFLLVTGCLFVILGERLGAKQPIGIQIMVILFWPLLLVFLALFGRDASHGNDKHTE